MHRIKNSEKILLLVLSIAIQCFGTVFAQENSEEIAFAFVDKAGADYGKLWVFDEAEYKSAYKFQTANQVFNQLIEARGDFRMRIPTLAMSEGRRSVAYAIPSKAKIVLEEKAYDLCASFGQDSLNALAALLAHELIHYYEKHDWTHRMLKDFKDTETGMQLKANNERLKFESQADLMGGLLAYSAGYKTMGIMPQFLDKVYTSYGLKENIKGYPSLSERKLFASQSLGKLEELVSVFDLANIHTAIGEYAYAKLLLEHILKDFQSREIYNNLGTMATLAALELLKGQESMFAYPLELDVETRLKNGNRGSTGDEEKITAFLLDEALKYFEQAIQLDKNYPSALLNKACVLHLQGEREDAAYFTRKAARLIDEKDSRTLSNLKMLQGIEAFWAGDIQHSVTHFRVAKDLGHPFAYVNLTLVGELSEVASSTSTANMTLDLSVLEQIDAALAASELHFDHTIKLSKNLLLGQQHSTASLCSAMVQQNGDYTLIVAVPKSIELSTSTDLLEKLGAPVGKVQLSKGMYWRYKDALFLLQADKVVAQLLYRVGGAS